MKELKVIVRLSRTIQLEQYQPIKLEVELEGSIRSESERKQEMEKLHNEAETFISHKIREAINNRKGRN